MPVTPHAFPELIREGFEPHTVSQVWVGGASPTMVVDIAKTFDQKFDALSKHVESDRWSQRSQEDVAHMVRGDRGECGYERGPSRRRLSRRHNWLEQFALPS